MPVGCWDLIAERSASLVIRAFGTRHCDGRLEGRGPRALRLWSRRWPGSHLCVCATGL